MQLPVELPEAYGTERIFLTARDPHWLHAAWDLTGAQRHTYNTRSRDGHLVVRLHTPDPVGPPESEIGVHADSKSWFIHVRRAATRYTAELGYYDHRGEWKRVALSASTFTPPESVSQDTTVEFTTIPPEVSLAKLFEVVQQAVSAHAPLSEAVGEMRAEGRTDLPKTVPTSAPAWTPAQARALAEVVHLDDQRRVWMGSLEITELVRRHLQRELSSQSIPAAPPGPGGRSDEALGADQVPTPPGISSRSEIVEAKGPGQGFWMTLNAELVLYGATDSNATVTVSGREIRLRPDGTFSFRFALPDGQYPLEITARSADGHQTRMARLQFSRRTQRESQVGTHPQDDRLKPPTPEHFR